MLRKPINTGTYFLGIIFGSYALSRHSLILLIVSIVLLFHAFMSCDMIDDGKT
jgi:hypothetical protein